MTDQPMTVPDAVSMLDDGPSYPEFIGPASDDFATALRVLIDHARATASPGDLAALPGLLRSIFDNTAYEQRGRGIARRIEEHRCFPASPEVAPQGEYRCRRCGGVASRTSCAWATRSRHRRSGCRQSSVARLPPPAKGEAASGDDAFRWVTDRGARGTWFVLGYGLNDDRGDGPRVRMVVGEIGDPEQTAHNVVAALRTATPAATAGPFTETEQFMLYPPVGWLNRIDEVLRHHGVVTHVGSHLGMALGRLIRSWEGLDARRANTAPGPDHWGEGESESGDEDYRAMNKRWRRAMKDERTDTARAVFTRDTAADALSLLDATDGASRVESARRVGARRIDARVWRKP